MEILPRLCDLTASQIAARDRALPALLRAHPARQEGSAPAALGRTPSRRVGGLSRTGNSVSLLRESDISGRASAPRSTSTGALRERLQAIDDDVDESRRITEPRGFI
jgi:hypothetical protein